MQGPYREYSIDLSSYVDLELLPVLFAGVYDPEVASAALENGVVLLSWGGGAVDVVVPPCIQVGDSSHDSLHGF